MAWRRARLLFCNASSGAAAALIAAFQSGCNSRRAGGWLHRETVRSIAYNGGRGTRDAFEILADGVRNDYVQPEVNELQLDIYKAHIALLSLDNDPLTREMIGQAADAQRNYAESLLEHLPVAFAHAFETVADELNGTVQCPWTGAGRSVMGVWWGADRPLRSNWHAGLKAWGKFHREDLWRHVLDYLEEKLVTLPG